MTILPLSGTALDEDPRVSRTDALLHSWLAHRVCTVAPKTVRADQDLLRLVPRTYLKRDPRTLTPADVDGILVAMRARGLSELSIRRHRASLSRFFKWCVEIGVLTRSPMPRTTTSRGRAAVVVPVRDVRPFGAEELESVWSEWSRHDAVLADVMLVLSRTGLRWSEARALRVDAVEDDTISVDRVAVEGQPLRMLPPSQRRAVRVARRIRPIVGGLVEGKDGDELLLTTSRGAQLHRTAVMRTLAWTETGRGRRLHDLRHTAARVWLEAGVEPTQVQQWMGPTRLVEQQLAS
jgi:integrase